MESETLLSPLSRSRTKGTPNLFLQERFRAGSRPGAEPRRTDDRHSPWCSRGLAACAYVLYSQFVTATDHAHVSRLLKKYMILLDIPIARNEYLFCRHKRDEIAHCQRSFQDLVISFLMPDFPQLLQPVTAPSGDPREEVIKPLHGGESTAGDV